MCVMFLCTMIQYSTAAWGGPPLRALGLMACPPSQPRPLQPLPWTIYQLQARKVGSPLQPIQCLGWLCIKHAIFYRPSILPPPSGHPSSPSRLPPPERAAIVPKPKFLEQLESYLHKELRLLGCPPCGPHELRLQVCDMVLQVLPPLSHTHCPPRLSLSFSLFLSTCTHTIQAHREVFEYLIEEFKTYKPLLSAIKSEYDLLITQQQEALRELEPLRVSSSARTPRCQLAMFTLYNCFSGAAGNSEGGV